MDPSNRLNLSYVEEAASFQKLPYPIIDVHSHINGSHAVELFGKAAELYGVGLIYSMTWLEQVPEVKRVLGDRIRFIAMASFTGDPIANHRTLFAQRVREFHKHGGRIVKFWCAPRSLEIASACGCPDLMSLRSPHYRDVMKMAVDLGMACMTHVGDPDTWFQTRYKDAAVYGTKRSQYEPLEEVLTAYPLKWIAAHMGGWPEDLNFLSGMLERHPNLYLDTSATKWIVREVSKHPRDAVVAFLTRWKGRILFGSDIVTSEEHLTGGSKQNEMAKKASSENEAFNLYASRYWALRKLWETDYNGESPIADPDLAMVNPEKYGPLDAPQLVGKSLPPDVLESLYWKAAHDLLEPLHK